VYVTAEVELFEPNESDVTLPRVVVKEEMLLLRVHV
jgi:hypothetical protein